jgi:hypothetical protein
LHRRETDIKKETDTKRKTVRKIREVKQRVGKKLKRTSQNRRKDKGKTEGKVVLR